MIPEEVLNQLRNLNSEEVAVGFGLEVQRHLAHCFMHEDRNPSLSFKNNRWKCFACDKGGDAISLVQEMFEVSFLDACQLLCEKKGISFPENGNRKTKRKLSVLPPRRWQKKPERETQFDAEVAQDIVDFLHLGEKGKEFLFTKRKLHADVVSRVGIKSCEDELSLLTFLKTKFETKRLVECKLMNSSGRMSINAPSLVIPYYDEAQRIIALQTRYLGNRDNIPRFKMLCNSKTSLYNLAIVSKMKKGETLFIMEGITDCLAMLSDGHKAIAIQSASSIPEEPLSRLTSFRLKMLADNDEAGYRAFLKLAKIFLRKGVKLTSVDLPEGCKDYSEYYITKQ